ncbi:hypothetical protein RND81_14G224000 [Saponaria officinalis]|uniref:Secreted protein n=1 Tax=Saponaria officinalis TaxID=3572 RepID=A0AAW1GU11_SAPOF
MLTHGICLLEVTFLVIESINACFPLSNKTVAFATALTCSSKDLVQCRLVSSLISWSDSGEKRN